MTGLVHHYLTRRWVGTLTTLVSAQQERRLLRLRIRSGY